MQKDCIPWLANGVELGGIHIASGTERNIRIERPERKEPEQYTKVSQLKEKVLDLAKRQINEHTDIVFDYELLKVRGRSFDTIKLFCGFSKPNLNFNWILILKGI